MPKGIYQRRKGQYANRKLRDLYDRFFSNVEFTETCWLWTAGLRSKRTGYGGFWLNGKTRSAHQVCYELLVGPIPNGLELDHLCRVRRCIRPEHLEPVTTQENIRRGEVGLWERQKTLCPRGHEYSGENTYYQKSKYGLKRQCKQCKMITWHAWKARQKARPSTAQQ